MPHLETCLGILRRLIAKGDPNGIPLAERAINEYCDVTPAQARKSGLRFLQQDVLDQRDAVLGDQRSFADTVNALYREEIKGLTPEVLEANYVAAATRPGAISVYRIQH